MGTPKKPAQTHPSKITFTAEDAVGMAKAMCKGFRSWEEKDALPLCLAAIKAFNNGETSFHKDEGIGVYGDRRYYFRFFLEADGAVAIQHGYYWFVDDDEVPCFDLVCRYTK